MSLPKHRKIVWFFLISTGTLTVLYIARGIHYSLLRPTITRDYYAEHNAAHAGLSEDEKAWSAYYDAQQAWNTIAAPIRQRVMELAAEFDNRQTELEASDPFYDRLPNPFVNWSNPFGIPTDHPMHRMAIEALESSQPILDTIRQAASKPAIGVTITDRWLDGRKWTPDFALDPTPDLQSRPSLFDTAVFKSVPVGFIRDLLVFDSCEAASRQDIDRVVANIHAMTHIARQIRSEQAVSDQLVAARFLEAACEIALMAVNRSDAHFQDAHLQSIGDTLWQASLLHKHIDTTFERRITDEMIERTYSGSPGAEGHITIDGINLFHEMNAEPAPPGWFFAALWPIRYNFATRSEATRNFTDGFAALDAFVAHGPETYPTFLQALAEIKGREQRKPYPLLTSAPLEALGRAELIRPLTYTRLRATAARLALERYKLAEGRYPNTLADLVPTYLPALPQDPFNPSHPIKYLLRDGQPILYSVGSNGLDDHATPAPPNTNPSDLAARFADPAGPSPTAPKADWILYPPND